MDLDTNWLIGGRTQHVEVRQYFLHDLKHEGTIPVEWVSGEKMSSGIFTKNCPGPLYEKHVKRFCGWDMYGKKNGG